MTHYDNYKRNLVSLGYLVVFGITSPKGFENTWVSSEGAAIQLRNGKATMKFLDKAFSIEPGQKISFFNKYCSFFSNKILLSFLSSWKDLVIESPL